MLLKVIALLFVVLHAISWFNQPPQAIVGAHIRGRVYAKGDRHVHVSALARVISGGSLDNHGPMMTKRSPQPFLWLLFSAGGMVTALLTKEYIARGA